MTSANPDVSAMWYIDNIRDNMESSYGGDIRVRESMRTSISEGKKTLLYGRRSFAYGLHTAPKE
jgi:hypothetical protein